MAKGNENDEKVNVKKEKEELHKRLESKVLGMFEDTEDSGMREEKDKKDGKSESKLGKEEATASGEPPGKAHSEDTNEENAPESGADKHEKPEGKEHAGKKPPEEEKDSEPPEEKPAEETKDEKPVADKESRAEAGGNDAKKSGDVMKKETPEESLDEMLTQREEIEALLSSIEDSYRDATLPDKTYHEVKSKNEKKLEEVNVKIKNMQKTATPKELKKIEERLEEAEKPVQSAPTEPDSIRPVETAPKVGPTGKPAAAEVGKGQQKKADAVIEMLEEKIEDKLRNVIDTANIEITDKRMKKLEGRLDVVERSAKDIKGTSDTTSQTVGGYDKQFTLMKTDVEKIKAMVDSVKEAKNIMDEKFQRTTENFAEIRSIVYQREARAKEEEVIIDKLKDTISQVDTARILREFTTRDEQLRDVNTRLERMERSEKMLSDSLNRIKGLMTDIGSLENIVKASKHVGEKLEKIQEIEGRMKASSSKLDGIYVDMKKKLDEFTEYKVKQDKLSEMADDIMKNVEELTRRLSDYATKTDIATINDELKIVRDQAKKAQAVQVSPEVAGMREEKEEIESILSMLEENYKNKEIAEAEYKKAKESNMLKLAEAEKKIAAASSGKMPANAGGKPSGGSAENKHTRVMMLAKLREAYENGELSKAAYDKSRRLLLKKG